MNSYDLREYLDSDGTVRLLVNENSICCLTVGVSTGGAELLHQVDERIGFARRRPPMPTPRPRAAITATTHSSVVLFVHS